MGIPNQTGLAVEKETRAMVNQLAQRMNKPAYIVVKELARAALDGKPGELKGFDMPEARTERLMVRAFRSFVRLTGGNMPDNVQTMTEIDKWLDAELYKAIAPADGGPVLITPVLLNKAKQKLQETLPLGEAMSEVAR